MTCNKGPAAARLIGESAILRHEANSCTRIRIPTGEVTDPGCCLTVEYGRVALCMYWSSREMG